MAYGVSVPSVYGYCERLSLRGREHAYLVPWGNRLPFPARGPVFKLK